MRIVLRDNITNELIVELYSMIEEGLTEEEINKMLMENADDETMELLQNENYYISYE